MPTQMPAHESRRRWGRSAGNHVESCLASVLPFAVLVALAAALATQVLVQRYAAGGDARDIIAARRW